jgi:hypothetical protein
MWTTAALRSNGRRRCLRNSGWRGRSPHRDLPRCLHPGRWLSGAWEDVAEAAGNAPILQRFSVKLTRLASATQKRLFRTAAQVSVRSYGWHGSMSLQTAVRMRAGRCFRADPSLAGGPAPAGRQRRHGPKMKCKKSSSSPEPSAQYTREGTSYGRCGSEPCRSCTRR